MQASNATTALERCDTSEAKHVLRLLALAPLPLRGVWHAAGALSDAVLQQQTAASLAFAYAPKAHGACNLHDATLAMSIRACAFFSSVAALLGGGDRPTMLLLTRAWTRSIFRRARGAASTTYSGVHGRK